MTQRQNNTSYALLAIALAASLLYRPVIAADPDPSQATGAGPGAQALSEPLQEDFDTLIRTIEDGQPPPARPVQAGSGAGTTEEQLDAARIQIGILQQAVIAALSARAEAEADLEALLRSSRAEIAALNSPQSEDATPVGALATAKGEPVGDVRAAAFHAADEAAADDAAIAPAAGPGEIKLNEIHFDPGSATLTPGGERRTLEAADRIKALGARNVRVSGYTDTKGPAAYNMHLSLQRARSIADLLESVGVSAEIIAVQGYGEDDVPEPTADQISEPLNRCAGIFAMVDLPANPAQP